MQHSVLLRTLGAAVAALLTSPAPGQDTAPADRLAGLESVVVGGETTNAAIVADDLERWQANDLADVFRTVPSVSVGGSLGIAQKIYIRGVEDTLLNVKVDGAPQTGTLFHHIGRVGVEPELLERVEVQAGAGEATSGFGAIGGAIRFRTRSADDLLAADERFGGFVKGGYFSNAGDKLSLAAYGRLSDAWSLLGAYVDVSRENMDDGDGNELYGTAAEQSLAFVKATGRFDGGGQLSLSFEQRDEQGEFGQRPNWPVLEGEPLFPGEAERRTLVANYSLAASEAVNLETTFYTTESEFVQDRYDRWGPYGARIESRGFDLRNTTRAGAHELVYGLEHRSDEVVSRYLAEPGVWQAWAWDPNVGRVEEQGDLAGLYVQDHWRIAEPVLLSFGLRYDDYELDQVTYGGGTASDGVSANLGLRYDFTPNLSVTAGTAEAMRGKEIGDAFTLERQPGRIALDPMLDAEQVRNNEVGLVFDDGRWIASATVFRMRIEDVIMDQLGGGPAPQDGIYYENIGGLEADGFELRLGYGLANVRAELFFSTYDSELNGNTVEGYEQNGIANASGDRWNLNVAYRPARGVELGWNVQIVEDLDDIQVLQRALEIGWIDALQTVDKPGYTVHDAYVEWRPAGSDTWKFNFAVQNVFDELYRDHASVADYNAIPGWQGVAGLYEAGRDVRVTVSARF